MLSSLVVLYSLGLAFTRRLAERQKGRIEDYVGELLDLEKAAKTAQSIPDLDVHKLRLTEILAEAVNDMRKQRINAEGIQLFSFVWESVNYTINDHEEQLRLGPGVARASRKPSRGRKRSTG